MLRQLKNRSRPNLPTNGNSILAQSVLRNFGHGEMTEQFCRSTLSLDKDCTCFDWATLGSENALLSFLAFFHEHHSFSGLGLIQILGPLHQRSKSVYLNIKDENTSIT